MDQFDRPRQLLAIGAAMLAGFIDAVGFLSADGYFVSFMSGNTTRLAVDLATKAATALAPALIIGGFVIGAAAGAFVAMKAGRWKKPAVLGAVGTLLLLAAIAHAAGHSGWAIAPMVMAMGAINSTFQREDGVAFGLTYMTGALVRLGQGIGLTLAGVPQRGSWKPYLALWSGLAGGAIAGALLHLQAPGLPLWLASAWCAALTLGAWRVARAVQRST